MTRDIMLEPQQEQLLLALADAAQRVGREDRQKFLVISRGNSWQDVISHPGLPAGSILAFEGDHETLARAGLLAATRSRGETLVLDVTPLGFSRACFLRNSLASPTQRVETPIREYLSGSHFSARYPEVAKKLADADKLVWGPVGEPNVSLVGHTCREAIQLFATSLVGQTHPADAPENRTSTVARIRSVLATAKPRLGDRNGEFLDALVVYWGTVSDLIQRAEHGAAKQGPELVWEDARRVLFQTLILLYEVDRAISVPSPGAV